MEGPKFLFPETSLGRGGVATRPPTGGRRPRLKGIGHAPPEVAR